MGMGVWVQGGRVVGEVGFARDKLDKNAKWRSSLHVQAHYATRTQDEPVAVLGVCGRGAWLVLYECVPGSQGRVGGARIHGGEVGWATAFLRKDKGSSPRGRKNAVMWMCSRGSGCDVANRCAATTR